MIRWFDVCSSKSFEVFPELVCVLWVVKLFRAGVVPCGFSFMFNQVTYVSCKSVYFGLYSVVVMSVFVF